MKDLTIIILGIAFFIAMYLLAVGLAMVLIGAVGHWFNIETYQYISFWEVAGIGFIFGLLGFGSSR